MRHHRLAVGESDVEHQAVLLQAEIAACRGRRRGRPARTSFPRSDRRSRPPLVLDVGARAADRILVERDGDEALLAAGSARVIEPPRLRRMATERAMGVEPLGLAAARSADGPSAASCSGPHLRIEVRFMKSSTPRPEENRAERAVGSTWLEPRDIVADRLGRVRAEEDRAGIADARGQRFGIVDFDLEMLGRDRDRPAGSLPRGCAPGRWRRSRATSRRLSPPRGSVASWRSTASSTASAKPASSVIRIDCAAESCSACARRSAAIQSGLPFRRR